MPCCEQSAVREAVVNGRWVNVEMIQVFASVVMRLWDALARLEQRANSWNAFTRLSAEEHAAIGEVLKFSYDTCEQLNLGSAKKQAKHIGMRIAQGNCGSREFADAVAQLRRCIDEDLDDKVFYCIF